MTTSGIPPIPVSARIDNERLGLGIALTAIQASAFFSFVFLCTFYPALLQQDLFAIGVPLSFIAGLAVIACGIVLTAIYVVVSNRLPEGAK